MAQLQTLTISDGTNTIDLLSKRSDIGWKLRDATLNFPTFDGSWSSAPVAFGRTLSSYSLSNANDLYEVTLKASSSDSFNRMLADMRSMLLNAANYWTNGNVPFVYITMRGINESEYRYAIVKAGQLEGETSHWGQTFFQPDCEPVMEFDLAIERGMWCKYPPGNGEGIDICSAKVIEAYPGGTRYFVGIEGNPVADVQPWVGGTTASNFTSSDVAFTIGCRLPFHGDATDRWLFGQGETISVTYNWTQIRVEVALDTSNALTIVDIPEDLIGQWVYIDILWYEVTPGNWNATVYLNNTLATPSTFVSGVGTPDTQTGAYFYTLLEQWALGSVWPTYDPTPYPMEYFRIDATTPDLVVGQKRLVEGIVVYLCQEGPISIISSGQPLNSGTGGSPYDMTIPTASDLIWGIRNAADYNVFTGKEDCDTAETVITNTSLPIPITHIFMYASMLTTYSVNLAELTPPFELVPFPPDVGDYLYVGSTVARFPQIVFNLNPSAEAMNDPTGPDLWNNWEFSQGGSVWSAFATLGGYDTTRSLSVPGVGVVGGVFDSNDWELETVNGVEAYWMRLPFNATSYQTSGISWVPPQQADYPVYSGANHVDVGQYDGEASGLTRYNFNGQSLSYRQRDQFPCVFAIQNIVGGFRSNSRGFYFTSMLSVQNDLLFSGIATRFVTPVENSAAPGGWMATMVASTFDNGETFIASWTIDETIAKQFAGRFRVYARISTSQTAGGFSSLGATTGYIACTVAMGSNAGGFATNTQSVDRAVGKDLISTSSGLSTRFILYDVGSIQIPDTQLYNTKSAITLTMSFRYADVTDSDELYLSDIVLIPADEYYFSSYLPTETTETGRISVGTIINGTGSDYDMFNRKNLTIDSLTSERSGSKAFEYIDVNYRMTTVVVPGSVLWIPEGIVGQWNYDSALPVTIPNVDGGGRMFFCYPYEIVATATGLTVVSNPIYYSLGVS